MDSELIGKVVERVKFVAGIEAFLVLPVTALYLAVVAGRVGADELVSDAQFSNGGFEESRQILFTVGKTVGELKPVIRLDTLHPNPPVGIPLGQPFQEIG